MFGFLWLFGFVWLLLGVIFWFFCSFLTPLSWEEVGRWGKYRYDVRSYRGSQCGCCQTAFTNRSEKYHSALCFFRFLLLLLPRERSKAVDSGVIKEVKAVWMCNR